jgi:prepilin-type N-terminal cleavage/methylation domain-containing protein
MSPASRGLTLIELVVVLAVLAAVAAIVAPLMPNMVRRAHKSTEATQTVEVAKAVQMYQASYMGYPDNFDLLTDGTTFPAYMPADGGNVFGGYAVPATLTTAETEALAEAGVKRLQTMATNNTGTNFHPTMNPYNGTISTDVVTVADNTTTKFAVIDPTTNSTVMSSRFLQSVRNNDPTARYVVFGVGPRNSMVGTVMQDPPTVVPGSNTLSPANSYARIGVVFKVSGVEVNSSKRARFIGAVVLEDDAIETSEDGIIGYYEVAKDPSASGS